MVQMKHPVRAENSNCVCVDHKLRKPESNKNNKKGISNKLPINITINSSYTAAVVALLLLVSIMRVHHYDI